MEEYQKHDSYQVSSDMNEQLNIAKTRNFIESKAKLHIKDLGSLETIAPIKTEKFKEMMNDWNAELFNMPKPQEIGFVQTIFEELGYFERYKMKKDVFERFVNIIHYYYSFKKNPFHNFTHGMAGKPSLGNFF